MRLYVQIPEEERPFLRFEVYCTSKGRVNLGLDSWFSNSNISQSKLAGFCFQATMLAWFCTEVVWDLFQMIVLLILCLFFYYFCDPCALLPDLPETALKVFEIYYPNLLTYFVLLVLMHFLLNVSGEFITNVRYIPYNISLNMLIPQRKDKFTRQVFLQYLCTRISLN